MSFYRKYRALLNLLGLVLLIALVLFFKIDLRQTMNLLARANVVDVGLAVLFFVPFLLTKAWRWQVILHDLGIPISFGESLKLYALGLGAGMVTPGQVGDAIKVAYFRERGLGRALLSVLLDRMWDVLALLLLTASGAILFWHEFQREWLVVGFLTAGTIAFLAIISSPRAQTWLLGIVIRLRRTRETRSTLTPVQLSGRQILRQFGLTLLATAVVYFRLYLLTSALDVRLELVPFIAAMSLATIAALLPFSIAGLGTRDAALLIIAPVIGLQPEEALGLSTLILLLSILNGVVGLLVWFAQPRQIQRRAS